MGILFLLILVGVGVYLWRTNDDKQWIRTSPPTKQEDGALQLLRERYARGEIDHDEYQRRKEDLS